MIIPLIYQAAAVVHQRLINGSSGSSSSQLFTEIIDGIPVSMIKRVRTIDGAEEYVVDLKLTDIGFVGVEDTDYEMIYGIEV